jgi:hypothetical protein
MVPFMEVITCKLIPLAVLLIVFASIASTVQAAQVELDWEAPTTNANNTPLTDLAGHRVHYGQTSRQYAFSLDVKLATSASIADLEVGKTYYFAVTAYDTSGNVSDYSTELSYTVPIGDTDGDGLSDEQEVNIYGTDPERADTDGDGIPDGAEVAFWGSDWDADADGDGLINLLDRDADNDAFTDGVERSQGSVRPIPTRCRPRWKAWCCRKRGRLLSAAMAQLSGGYLFSGGSTKTVTAAIAGTTDDRSIKVTRYTSSFSFTLPLTNGDYLVT